MRWMLLMCAALVAVGCGDVPADDEPIVITTEDMGTGDARGAELGADLPECEPLECAADDCGEVTNECGELLDCGVCVDEARLEVLATWVDDYVQQIRERSFAQSVVDYDPDRLSTEARQIIRDGQASDASFVSALRHAMLESHIGHATFYEATSYTCTAIDGAGDGGASRYGACAVPHRDGVLISVAEDGNALGLSPGDLVTAVDGVGGDALFDWSLNRPVCSGGAASEQARLEEAARSFFAALPVGAQLTVRAPDGVERTVEVPAPSALDWLYCRDALGRDTNHVARAELRDDGVAVIHLPGFVPLGGFDPNTDPWAQMEALEDDILAEFDSVKDDATAIIWDVRGNIGGASPVGFTIAGGMPGATEVAIARCTTRIPNTQPPEYNHAGPDYDLTINDKFAFDGPVAVLTDGRTISAGDYFARAVALGTDAVLVGTPTSGAYGGSGATFPIAGELGLVAAYDPFRCNDALGDPLETRGVEPHHTVEYDPMDLAAGVDTVLEHAAAELLR